MQRRVRFAVLVQLAERGAADRVTTAAMVPGVDERDLIEALENLLDEGSIEVLADAASTEAPERLSTAGGVETQAIRPVAATAEPQTGRPGSLLDLAGAGRLKLTPFGRSRLNDDGI